MAAAVAAVSMVSCDNDDSKPTIEFSKPYIPFTRRELSMLMWW